MDRMTGWWGIAVLAFVVGCGSPGPAPGSSPAPSAPESSGPPAVETAPGSASSATPPGVESPSPAAAESAPTGEPPSQGLATKPSDSEKPEQAGANAAVPLEQLPSWAAALVGNDVQAREAASEKLDRVSIAGPQPLMPLLQDASPDVRRGTIFYLLDRFDPADAAVVAALAKCLTDQDAPVRRLALTAAQRFPLDGLVQWLPQLIEIMKHPQESADSRAAAARLIGTLEGAARKAVPALVRAAGLPETIRGERLTLADFIVLSDILSE